MFLNHNERNESVPAMKKLLSLMLAAVFLAAFLTAFAEETQEPANWSTFYQGTDGQARQGIEITSGQSTDGVNVTPVSGPEQADTDDGSSNGEEGSAD
jgi:hypothetical protein